MNLSKNIFLSIIFFSCFLTWSAEQSGKVPQESIAKKASLVVASVMSGYCTAVVTASAALTTFLHAALLTQPQNPSEFKEIILEMGYSQTMLLTVAVLMNLGCYQVFKATAQAFQNKNPEETPALI